MKKIFKQLASKSVEESNEYRIIMKSLTNLIGPHYPKTLQGRVIELSYRYHKMMGAIYFSISEKL